jgi:hypothetical protein
VTTRYKGVVVSFDRDIREDDAESLLTAIRMIKGVIGVQPVEAGSMHDSIVEMRVRSEIEKRIWDALRRQ